MQVKDLHGGSVAAGLRSLIFIRLVQTTSAGDDVGARRGWTTTRRCAHGIAKMRAKMATMSSTQGQVADPQVPTAGAATCVGLLRPAPARGSAVPTRTPTDCCASTFPKGTDLSAFGPKTWNTSPNNSTADPHKTLD